MVMEVAVVLAAFATIGAAATAAAISLKLLKQEKAEKSRQPKLRVPSFRQTQVLSISPSGLCRLKDGGFLAGYEFAPSPTLYDTLETEEVYDRLASLLKTDHKHKVYFQFRVGVNKDKPAIDQLLHEEVGYPASILASSNKEHLKALASAGLIRELRFSLWVYVDVRTQFDPQGGLFELFFASKQKLMQRSAEAERFAVEEAEKVLRAIERDFPLKLRRLTAEELFAAMYFDHNQSAKEVPRLDFSSTRRVDTRILRSSIKFSDSWWVVDDNVPSAVLTMFEPPATDERPLFAGLMRMLVNNPTLRSKMSVIVEFLPIDKDKTLRDIRFQRRKLELFSRIASKASKEQIKKYRELDQIEEELIGWEKAVAMRFRVVLYGNEANSADELKAELNKLRRAADDVLKAIRQFFFGADFSFEEGVALRQLYEHTLIGEMKRDSDGREIQENASNLVVFAPIEDSWQGVAKGHTLRITATGRPFVIDLWNNPYSSSPLVCVLGASGSGKSMECGQLAIDALARVPHARVRILDFGGTYRDLVESLNGRVLDFSDELPLNLLWYNGLEEGEPPDEEQVSLVTEEVAVLCGYDSSTEDGRVKHAVVTKAVRELYKDYYPRNRLSRVKTEPTLSSLIAKLKTFPYETQTEVTEAARVAAQLSAYEKHKILDAQMDEKYKRFEQIEVVEMESLMRFSSAIRRALAFRAAAYVARSALKQGDVFLPTLIIFDEMHEYNDPNAPELRVVFRALEKGVRKGRKTNTVTIIATHSWEDISAIHGLVSNAGIFIVGKSEHIDTLCKAKQWKDEIASAIKSIKTSKDFRQFLYHVGQGSEAKSELVMSSVSSLTLWTLTTAPKERNLKARLRKELDATPLEIMSLLAARYPQGLAGEEEPDIEFFLSVLGNKQQTTQMTTAKTADIDLDIDLDVRL